MKALLIEEIIDIATRLANTAEPSHAGQATHIPSLVDSPRVSAELFDYLIGNNQLPTEVEGCRIVYELDRYRIKVQVVPSGCHDAAAESFMEDFILWNNSGGQRGWLQPLGGGSTTPVSKSLMKVWPYAPSTRKSSDKSFRPPDIQCPPGTLVPGTTVAYPTFTVEVAKSHETLPQLERDAAEKHFALGTGVMIYLGIKIFPTQRMCVLVGERDVVQGHGMIILTRTGFIDTTSPCQAHVTIPTHLLYHGVPAHLIPLNQPADYVLDLELIRAAIDLNWDW
jgi:hypothetical protein